MKVAQIKNNQIILNEMPDVTLDGRRGAIVEVLGCGLCGSDIIKLVKKTSSDGTVLGHEIVARIVEINSDTDFKVGDTILSSHHVPCGKCVFCASGNESMCKHFKETNIEPGGFSEKVFLSEEHLQNMAYKKPEHLSDDEAAFYEPLGCCVRAIRRANLEQGASVLVIGLGSIGIIMAQALKAMGFDVTGLDLRQDRVDLLKTYGIEAVVNPSTLQPFNYSTIFMTSGADAAIETALKTVRDGGKIIVFSSTPRDMGYANNEIYHRELTVLGSYSPAVVDLKTSLDLLASGQVDVKNLSTIYDFEDINQAFSDTIENKILKAYIKIRD